MIGGVELPHKGSAQQDEVPAHTTNLKMGQQCLKEGRGLEFTSYGRAVNPLTWRMTLEANLG